MEPDAESSRVWLFMCLRRIGFAVGGTPMGQVKPISGQLPDGWQELQYSMPESSGTVLTDGLLAVAFSV